MVWVSCSPWRRATAAAPGAMAGAGWVPAEVDGHRAGLAHSAAASWERAEFAVHTNTTRVTGGRRGAGERAGPGQQAVEGAGDQAQVGASPVGLGPVPGDQPSRSSTPRWWANRFEVSPSWRAELAGGGVAEAEGVHDAQPGRVGDGSQRSCPPSHVAHRGSRRRLSVH